MRQRAVTFTTLPQRQPLLRLREQSVRRRRRRRRTRRGESSTRPRARDQRRPHEERQKALAMLLLRIVGTRHAAGDIRITAYRERERRMSHLRCCCCRILRSPRPPAFPVRAISSDLPFLLRKGRLAAPVAFHFCDP